VVRGRAGSTDEPSRGLDSQLRREMSGTPRSPPPTTRPRRSMHDDDDDDDHHGWGSPSGARGRVGTSRWDMSGPPGSPRVPRRSLTVTQPRLSHRRISCLKWCSCEEGPSEYRHSGEACFSLFHMLSWSRLLRAHCVRSTSEVVTRSHVRRQLRYPAPKHLMCMIAAIGTSRA
jgi:hypothetical protein